MDSFEEDFARIVMAGTLNLVLSKSHPMGERQRRQHLEDMADNDVGRVILAERIADLESTIAMLREYLPAPSTTTEQ